jgi:hypothetical protein
MDVFFLLIVLIKTTEEIIMVRFYGYNSPKSLYCNKTNKLTNVTTYNHWHIT